ncbi:MAG: hypothetical protein QXQ39_08155, partial [Conexivisphaerales archaeon]
MGWSGGGGSGASVSPDNETIKINTSGELYVVPATNLGGATNATGVGVNIDGVTLENTNGVIGV